LEGAQTKSVQRRRVSRLRPAFSRQKRAPKIKDKGSGFASLALIERVVEEMARPKPKAEGGHLTGQFVHSGQEVLHRGLQPFLFEPEQAHSQLPQIISRVTDWQLAGAPERVGGVSSKG
jgi:hypothetical protein